MKSTELSRVVPSKDMEDIYDILEENGIKYEKNHQLQDSLLVDIYLPEL
jgi:hypothetical protein